MNLYHLFVILFGLGLFMTVFPILASSQLFLENDLALLYFGVGSALMGGGIGCGVGYLVYRKEGKSNDE